ILFLDEIHRIIGFNSQDLGNMLKPPLARGSFRCIGATTPAEYARVIERDAALERRFQPVHVPEPTPAEALDIARGVRATYERFHQIGISDEAVQAAVDLSVRYLPDRRLPDKALDLVDEAAASKRVEKDRTPVSREDIARVVSARTGIPTTRVTTTQKQRLLEMEDVLRRRVLGQDAALRAVSEVVREGFAGLSVPGRPVGVFLFVGPTGVGKTELARALAEFLFDDDKKLLRFDMSEYQEAPSVSRLIGSPPGYIGHHDGGMLTDAVRRNPYCVVLFDEVEKAHPRVLDLFLQLFDAGTLTDTQGRKADFSNSIIVMTSNLGIEEQGRAQLGFRQRAEEKPPEVPDAVRKFFRPELLNRVRRIIPFSPLREDLLPGIVEMMLGRARQRLAAQQIRLEIAPEAMPASSSR
ncbi:MAG: AAA family ATPase, partial [Candidatus Xenobia bacterium]